MISFRAVGFGNHVAVFVRLKLDKEKLEKDKAEAKAREDLMNSMIAQNNRLTQFLEDALGSSEQVGISSNRLLLITLMRFAESTPHYKFICVIGSVSGAGASFSCTVSVASEGRDVGGPAEH